MALSLPALGASAGCVGALSGWEDFDEPSYPRQLDGGLDVRTDGALRDRDRGDHGNEIVEDADDPPDVELGPPLPATMVVEAGVSINVLSGPGTTFAKTIFSTVTLNKLSNGARVLVLNAEKDHKYDSITYYYVEYETTAGGRMRGYVPAVNCTCEAGPCNPPLVKYDYPALKPYLLRTTDLVMVMAGPGDNAGFEQIGNLKIDNDTEKDVVLGHPEPSWAFVEYNVTEGLVEINLHKRGYVRIDKIEEQAP